jgi:hypothetical protein
MYEQYCGTLYYQYGYVEKVVAMKIICRLKLKYIIPLL